MATLALGIVGSAIGSALLPGGVNILGAAISGASIGFAVGSTAGAVVDQALFGGRTRVSGPRLSDVKLGMSAEGGHIPRVYGRARVAGQLIWATRFEEQVRTVDAGGGKGTSSGGASTKVYTYLANAAYLLCEGPITRVGRIWADGKELKQSDFTIRVHKGTEDQEPDSLIEAKEGAGKAPPYRGIAYVVFERMALERFGNRLPQLNFEVFRAVDKFEESVKAVTLIPAAGEFIYDTARVLRRVDAESIPENVHTNLGGTDFKVAIDQLQDQLPGVRRVALVVTWFGNDLRIGHCTLRPGVEVPQKETTPYAWSVAGVSRGTAYVVSQSGGRPAYGGTPSDSAVLRAIQDLKARGLAVTFYPFISMDIPAGNALPNPYSDNASASGQPPYPWRGRLTCSPAPGFAGTVDKTSACASQVAAFVGSAAPEDFSIAGDTVLYAGPSEWSFRRFILHYAHLCEAAGGVDAFLIGSELRGATTLRAGASTFPFADALVSLASDVRSVLDPATKITYGADWTEYFGYQPGDGSGDVYFHLDPLWASSAIDAVGIDIYWPLSDWRDGDSHLDYQAGVRSIYDLAYLRGNIRGGEGFDWYYPAAGTTGNEPSPERKSQTRAAISDGTYGKHWVFRFKAIKEWWENAHFNRPGGVEEAMPTAWVPQSKPFWFTELGCPAIDKGANQPNVFFDPKSSESFFPFFSRGTRDDLIQRRYIEAFASFFDPAHEAFEEANNPVSGVYGARMVDASRVYIYTWDARPYPAFPYALDVWGDGGNWERGHWLTGRVAGGSLSAVVAQILLDYGFTRFAVGQLTGILEGLVIDRIMSARAALAPLELAFFFDSYESGGLIQFAHRGRLGSVATLNTDDLVERSEGAELYTLTRGQETELPVSAKLTYIDGIYDYRQGAVEARRLAVLSEAVAQAEVPIVMGQAAAQMVAETLLQEAWASRERGSFALPPSKLALEPADVVTLQAHGRRYPLRIVETQDGSFKGIEALSIEPHIYEAFRVDERGRPGPSVSIYDVPAVAFLDLPLIRGDEAPHAGYVAAEANPWPGAVAFYRSPTLSGFRLNTIVSERATMGETVWDFWSGPLYRFDRSNRLRVKLLRGELESVTEEALLNGANLAAIQNEDGEWELIQFATAELVGPRTYDLSNFLRGLHGTESAMRGFAHLSIPPVPAGAPFVLIDPAVTRVDMRPDDIGLAYHWRYGPAQADITDEAFGSAVHAFAGLGLRPLSPVHLRGKRNHTNGDWTFTWIRRTRQGGDSWESVEVPLAEEEERYRLDILDAPGGEVLRSVALTAPSFLYTAAMQTADFGSPQWNVPIRVAQISPVYGAGIAAEQLTFDFQH